MVLPGAPGSPYIYLTPVLFTMNTITAGSWYCYITPFFTRLQGPTVYTWNPAEMRV